MTQDKLTVVGDELEGRGMSFDVSALLASKGNLAPEARGGRLAEIGEAIYLQGHFQGRESVLPSWDDRFDLRSAVEALRALAVVVGGAMGERHRRASDVIERLLHEREREP